MGAAADRLVEALGSRGYRVKAEGRDRWRAQCPAHNGDDLNLSIAVGDQGVLTKCHSYDCPAEDVAKAVGLTLPDLFDRDGRAVYDYGGGHKVTRLRTRDGKKVVQSGFPRGSTSLYQHPDSEPITNPSGSVVLVEGEKCVDAALRLGEKCVTTWPSGASQVDRVDLSPLAGRSVRIIADNDPAGHAAAAKLVQRLEGLATVEGVWVVPGEKRGVDDLWLEGGSLSDLQPFVPPVPAEDLPRDVVLTKLSTVKTRMPRFLWDGVLPFGCLTLFGGRGGVAKSSFVIYLAGLITRGTLRGDLYGEPANVLYVSHEDSLEEVVGPRCDANGVDRERFYQIGVRSKEVDGVSVPRLPEDMPLIRKAIEQTGAKVIIIDPITSTIGGDNDKLADVRAVLDPLNALGAEYGVSVIAIAHFRKGGSGASADLISGSHAYRDASRCVMLFAKDEDMGNTVATVEKSNYGLSGQSFEFRLDIVDQMTDDGHQAKVGKVIWGGESSKDVGDLIAQEATGTERAKMGVLSQDIEDFVLSSVTVTTEQVVTQFKEHKPNTVRKALTRLHSKGRISSPAFSVWGRPDSGNSQGVTPKSDTSLGVPQVSQLSLSDKSDKSDINDAFPGARAGAHTRAMAHEQGESQESSDNDSVTQVRDARFCVGCGGRLDRDGICERPHTTTQIDAIARWGARHG